MRDTLQAGPGDQGNGACRRHDDAGWVGTGKKAHLGGRHVSLARDLGDDGRKNRVKQRLRNEDRPQQEAQAPVVSLLKHAFDFCPYVGTPGTPPQVTGRCPIAIRLSAPPIPFQGSPQGAAFEGVEDLRF